jgi:hypothetical protein
MHPLLIPPMARERPQHMQARADRQRLARSAARSGRSGPSAWLAYLRGVTGK